MCGFMFVAQLVDAIAVTDVNRFGPGLEQIVLDNVNCGGSEDTLQTGCPHEGLGQHNCDHSRDAAGVICQQGVVCTCAADVASV